MPRRKAGAPIRGAQAYHALRPRERETYLRSVNALSWMRDKSWSLSRTARELNVSPRSISKYAGSALRRDARGRYAPRPADRFYRELNFMTPDGPVVVGVHGSRRASEVARHAAAVKRFGETGDWEGLRPFSGKRLVVGAQELEYVTDPDVLTRLLEAGTVSFEDLYARAT